MPNRLKLLAKTFAVTATLGIAAGWHAPAMAATTKPTIVLVHGAFAESASWDGVITRLEADGYRVVAASNPLRSVKVDAASVASVIGGIDGPVVLVGHSYAGMVISAAALGHPNVKALVFVDAYEPEVGESAASLSKGASLGAHLAPPVALPDGSQDLYVAPGQFRSQMAADVPAAETALMEATQRPVTVAALNDPAGEPAWRTIPSWTIYGSADHAIPPATQAFMAKRAHSRHTVEISGSSHVSMVSHPREVTALIEEAARSQ